MAEKEATIATLMKDQGDKEELMRLSAANQRLTTELNDWKARVAAMQASLKEAKSNAHASTEALQANDAMRQELIRAQQDRERLEEEVNRLRQDFDRLQQENSDLKTELEAFDPSFFDELDDLKFNYNEALRLNAEYEERIRNLESQQSS